MARATELKLSNLHNALASELLQRIQSGEATPADFQAARGFLKDNDIRCDPKDPGKTIGDLSVVSGETRDKDGNVLEFPFDPQEATQEGL